MTKQLISTFKALSLAAVLGITASPCLAADKDPSTIKIAFVDLNKIQMESTALKMIGEKIEKHRASFQSDINKQEGKLREQEKSFENTPDKGAEAEQEKKRKEFHEQVMKLQKTVMERKASLQKAHETAVSKVNEIMMKIIQEARVKKGLIAIQPASLNLDYDKSLDITEEVLKLLNEKLPSVDVKLEKVTLSDIAPAA